MADTNGIQVDATKLIQKLRDKLAELTVQNSILEIALSESQGQQQALAAQLVAKEIELAEYKGLGDEPNKEAGS